MIRQDRGDLADAEVDVQRSIDWFEAQAPYDDSRLAGMYGARARIRLDRGDLIGAETDIEKAIKWGEMHTLRDVYNLASDYESRARILRDRAMRARDSGDPAHIQDLLNAARSDIGRSIEWYEGNLPEDLSIDRLRLIRVSIDAASGDGEG